jgi:hypothetical protein
MGMSGNPPQTPIEKYLIGVCGGFSWGTRPWGSTQRLDPWNELLPNSMGRRRRHVDRAAAVVSNRIYLRQTLSFGMQELPQGLPLTQFGVFSPVPAKQEFMNFCRASPLILMA